MIRLKAVCTYFFRRAIKNSYLEGKIARVTCNIVHR